MSGQSMPELSEQILGFVPQAAPFRYIDQIVEVHDQGIVGEYTFKPDEWFYQGHFPGQPVTPGVILIEAMAQTAVVAFGIYQLLASGRSPEEFLTLFTDVEAEFIKEVSPGTRVIIKGEKIFFRRMKLKARAEMFLECGTLVAAATLSGLGVKR